VVAHQVRTLQVPQLRGVAVLQAHGEHVGAGGPIGDQNIAGGQSFQDGDSHRFTPCVVMLRPTA